VTPGNDALVKRGGIYIKSRHGLPSRGSHRPPCEELGRPGLRHGPRPCAGRKDAEAAKRAYRTAAQSGLIDDLAGKHADKIHRGAARGMAAYDKFEDVAMKADRVARTMRGD
jgi:hypothetical protein